MSVCIELCAPGRQAAALRTECGTRLCSASSAIGSAEQRGHGILGLGNIDLIVALHSDSLLFTFFGKKNTFQRKYFSFRKSIFAPLLCNISASFRKNREGMEKNQEFLENIKKSDIMKADCQYASYFL